jgi:hypothetical protein
MDEEPETRFMVWAEVEGHSRPLIMTDLPPARLFDDIVVPYQAGERFFIDGAPVKAQDLKRIKILRAKEHLDSALSRFRMNLERSDTPTRKLYGEQYHIRYEAILREHTEDVTAQIIKAYDRAIKPRLKDYLPKREELIKAAMTVFVEGVKKLGTA